jgi:hypothetical protein
MASPSCQQTKKNPAKAGSICDSYKADKLS